MAITPLPTPVPTREDPNNFSDRADAFLAALPTFATEANTLADDVNAKQVIASNAADASAASAAQSEAFSNVSGSSASAAASLAGATAWVSGTTYTTGDVVYSTLSGYIYRRRTSGAGATDPSSDPSNWKLISTFFGNLTVVTTTSVQAEANGRYALTAAGITTVVLPSFALAGDYIEIIVANGRFDNVVDPNGGRIMSLALDESMTIDQDNAAFALEYVDGTSGWRIRSVGLSPTVEDSLTFEEAGFVKGLSQSTLSLTTPSVVYSNNTQRSRNSLNNGTDNSIIPTDSFILPAGSVGKNGRVIAEFEIAHSSSTAVKNVGMFIGGAAFGLECPTAVNTTHSNFTVVVMNNNSTTAQKWRSSVLKNQSSNGGMVFGSFDTNQNLTVSLGLRWSTGSVSGEFIRLESARVLVEYGV